MCKMDQMHIVTEKIWSDASAQPSLSGYEAVKQLVKVAKEPIVETGDDISADRLKNAAATKKLAIFDAFEILSRIEDEKGILENKPKEEIENTFKGFAERRSK